MTDSRYAQNKPRILLAIDIGTVFQSHDPAFIKWMNSKSPSKKMFGILGYEAVLLVKDQMLSTVEGTLKNIASNTSSVDQTLDPRIREQLVTIGGYPAFHYIIDFTLEMVGRSVVQQSFSPAIFNQFPISIRRHLASDDDQRKYAFVTRRLIENMLNPAFVSGIPLALTLDSIAACLMRVTPLANSPGQVLIERASPIARASCGRLLGSQISDFSSELIKHLLQLPQVGPPAE